MIQLLFFACSVAGISGVCTVITLYTTHHFIAYFLLYCGLTVYIVENWAFYQEIEVLKKNKCWDQSDERIRVLVSIIQTLTVEIQKLKYIQPNTKKAKIVRKMKSVDWTSF